MQDSTVLAHTPLNAALHSADAASGCSDRGSGTTDPHASRPARAAVSLTGGASVTSTVIGHQAEGDVGGPQRTRTEMKQRRQLIARRGASELARATAGAAAGAAARGFVPARVSSPRSR